MQYICSLCCLLFIFSVSSTLAQQLQNEAPVTLTGQLKDSSLQVIPNATIKLMRASDTAKAKYQVSDSLGRFLFTKLTPDTYVLDINIQSFNHLQKYVSVDATQEALDMGSILLAVAYNGMEDVSVTAVRPVRMNGDTTEFNAEAFAVKPAATVGDLLNKISGLEVDKDGAVQADGERVTKIYVNGKPFFGDDPAMAIKNLPADAVKKIQVYDGQTDQSKFTGFDDGRRIKTINIVTKRRFKGWFGRPSIALGTGELNLDNPLYRIDGKAFRYGEDKQLSFVAKVNNVNGSQAGKSHTTQVGANYRDIIGEKTKISGSYRLDENKTVRKTTSWRQDLYANDTVFNKNSSQTSGSHDLDHHFSLDWETKFDTLNELYIRPRLNFGTNRSTNLTNTSIDSAYLDNVVPKNKTTREGNSNGNHEDLSVSTTYNHRFKKRGRSISLDVNFKQGRRNSNTLSDVDLYNYSIDSLEITRRSAINQYSAQSYRANLDYTEPFGIHHMVQLEFNAAYSKSESNHLAYNFDEVDQDYTSIDTALTNFYGNTYKSTRSSLNYRYHTEHINLSVGSGVQWGHVLSDNRTKNTYIRQNYTNFYPTASFIYHYNKWRQIRFRYQGRSDQPSISQMQPIVDNSNPLYIRSGNPDLKQRFNHQFSLEYRNRDSLSNRSITAKMDMELAMNSVVNSIRRLDNGGQYSMPVNINGNYNINAYLNFGLPVNFIKSNLDLQTRVSNRHGVNLIDQVKNQTTHITLSENFRWRTNLKQSFDINFSTQPTYNLTSYSVSNRTNGNYFDQRFAFDGTWYTQSGWESTAELHYTLYAGLPKEQQNNSTILNLRIAKSLFNDAAKIGLSVTDLLNQSKGISFSRSDNYIQQSQTEVFKRYFLLTFTYNLRHLNKQQSPSGDHRRRGNG